MAVQALVTQHILFISASNSFDENILSNSLIQTLANNSVGNDLVVGYNSFVHWDGTNWTTSGYCELICIVTVAFQTTIQANIPNLQAAFPEYRVVTWGYPVSYGN